MFSRIIVDILSSIAVTHQIPRSKYNEKGKYYLGASYTRGLNMDLALNL